MLNLDASIKGVLSLIELRAFEYGSNVSFSSLGQIGVLLTKSIVLVSRRLYQTEKKLIYNK